MWGLCNTQQEAHDFKAYNSAKAEASLNSRLVKGDPWTLISQIAIGHFLMIENELPNESVTAAIEWKGFRLENTLKKRSWEGFIKSQGMPILFKYL